MHIYGSTASPFVQRVLMTARLKGHEIALLPPPGGSVRSPGFVAISPMGRVPVLEDGDWRLCESEAIAAYLDEVLDGPPLLPADPRDRASARQIVAIAAGEVGAGLRPVLLDRVFGMGDEPALAEAGRAQLARGLDAIERLLDPAHRMAAGDRPGVADALLAPLLALMTIIDPLADTAGLIAQRPRIAAYWARAKADPVVARSIGEMEEGFAPVLRQAGAQAAG